MAEAVLYKEFHTLRWLTWGLGVASVLLLFYAIGDDAPANGSLVVGAFVGFFAAQFIAAVHRYNRITLTRSELRVGKETFTRPDIDFSFGVQPPAVLSPTEHDRVIEEWPVPDELDVRIPGGSWMRRRATSTIVLKEADRDVALAISTHRPLQLDTALTEWLETPP